MIGDDCELACDRNVVSRFGEESSDSYMYTILEIAKRMCAVKSCAGVKALGSGLFFSESSGRRFMERRYLNMKAQHKNKFAIPVTIAALLVCAMIGTAAITSCGIPVDVNAATGNIIYDGWRCSMRAYAPIRRRWATPHKEHARRD